MADISVAQVDQAEAALVAAKAASKAAPQNMQLRKAYDDAAAALTQVRVAFREQEEEAGNRRSVVRIEGEE